MAYQTGSRTLAAIRVETTLGVIATVTGATQIRLIGGAGLERKRANIDSAERLTNGLTAMTRLGHVSVDGGFESELSVGGFTDLAAQSIMRAAWVTSTTTAFSSLTTVAVQTNALVATAGSWLTQGVRIGDLFTLSGTSQSANNGLNHRVIALTTATLSTIAGTFTAVAASATGTLTALGKLYTGTTPTRYSYTIEQLDQDITQSERFLGCRLVALALSFKPGQMAKLTTTWMGLDRSFSNAAYFTSPTLTTSQQLVGDDSVIRYNGADVANFSGLDLNYQISAQDEQLIGSLTSPDVFDNNLVVTGSITALRSDFANLTLFDAETIFELEIKLSETTGSPPACFALYLPAVKIGALSAGPIAAGNGAKTETLSLKIGPKTADTTHDGGISTFYSSAK